MAKDYGGLWNDIINAVDETKAVRTLAEVLADKEGRTFLLRLEPEDAEFCVEILDRGITEHNLKPTEKQAFFVLLRRFAGCYGRLPGSMIITEKIETLDNVPASGGFADVRRGTYMGQPVAVKTMRVTERDDFQKIRKQFCKEVVLWNTLSHPNVLKFIGVQGDMGKGQFATVSEWMAHGSIMEYTRDNHVNRLELLHGAAQGLKYLHGAVLAHGDLKGANILMTNTTPPRACLTDFGLMTIVLDPIQPMSSSTQLESRTMTFMSPELLVPSRYGMKDSVPTQEADIYAFGLVIFQVLTGEIPFRSVRQTELGRSVVQGLRPDKPENASAIGLSDLLWDFVQRCWDGDRGLRPKAAEVVTCLGKVATNWDGFMQPCVWAENVAPNSEEEMPDLMEHCRIFHPYSDVALESPTVSQTTSEPFSCPRAPSTQCTESIEAETVASALREESDLMECWNTMAAPNPPQQLCVPDRTFFQFPNQIPSSLCEKKFEDYVSHLQDEDAAQVVDWLDNVLRTLDPASPPFRGYVHRLRWVCGARGILPRSCIISHTSLLNTSDHPFASGAFADMYEGSLNGSKVCVERVRMYSNAEQQRARKMFCEEVVAWKHLNHRNIVPFLGATLDPPQLVSVWMPGGDLTEYVIAHPEKNRFGLLYDVAQGLEYLHCQDMIHGDLKVTNILVDSTGHACIAGLHLIVAASDPESTRTFTEGPAVRLAAPEVLGGDTTISREADVFSFAMLLFEVITGATPFAHIPPTAAAVGIMLGKRPERPARSSLTDELWDLNQRCWDQNPLRRPRISEVVCNLRTALDVQGSHADGAGVSTASDTVSTSSRQKEIPHRSRYKPPRSIAARLLVLCRLRRSSPKYGVPFDERSETESNGSGDTLRDTTLGEWEKPLSIQNTPSGSHGFLRRAVVRFSSLRAHSSQSHDGCPDSFSDNFPDKHSTASGPSDLPPTSNHKKYRSCMSLQLSCFSTRGSNKYMDQ